MSIDSIRNGPRVVAIALAGALAWMTPGTAAAEGPRSVDSQLAGLLDEAIANNPEIAAARFERDAARQRIAPAGAFDDPMLEAGVLNVPVDSLSLNREDMTMKMLGIVQKLPYPGKRDLRRAVASADADSMDLAVGEVTNRIVRDVRVAYDEVAFNEEAQRIIARTRTALDQLEAIARSRYEVGQGAQVDVLDAQAEIERLNAETLRLVRENAVLQSELKRLLGRSGAGTPISVAAPRLAAGPDAEKDTVALALANRPQLLALQALVDRGSREIELAEREYYPDFDVRLQYGQRDNAPDGMQRDDMVSLTVAVNLPIWRKTRLDPQVAEARAMRSRAQSMLLAQQLETQAAIETQLAVATQARRTAELYQNSLLPQLRAEVASALVAYRVGQVDFLTLRQAQVREYEVSTQLAEAITNHNKAIAETDLLVGRAAP